MATVKKQQEIRAVETEDVMEATSPLPSVPVENEIVLPPVVQRDEMHYLGTYSMPGMKGVRAAGTKVAALPVIVTANDCVVGVVVVSDPGVIGDALAAAIASSGYRGPFIFSLAATAHRSVKLAAARAIAVQQEPLLDRAGALMMLGYTPGQLLG